MAIEYKLTPIPIDFETDGCTGWPDLNYRDCCVQHDYSSFLGIPDSVADKDLFVCVASKQDPAFAAMMVIGLFLFRPLYRGLKKIKAFIFKGRNLR